MSDNLCATRYHATP